ncbi:hypothetical protein [Niastella vici]|uniref:hypothetical protein n=1 Tax=Niastella vici TaxID=1703345 RepID=UPI001301B0EB|nr:hypothetical protein [Niastella vici]
MKQPKKAANHGTTPFNSMIMREKNFKKRLETGMKEDGNSRNMIQLTTLFIRQ